MVANGLPTTFADQLYEMIRGFGEYGFPESHAASFALLTYVSSWLKCHYPAAFTAALLNSQPMGFYAPAQLVRDVQAHGVTVQPVDVNESDWDCTLRPTQEGIALRLGFRMIRGASEAMARCIVEARADRPFRSLPEFMRRTALSRASLVRLAGADAFGSLQLGTRPALWHALSRHEELPLFADLDDEAPAPHLPAVPLAEQIVADYDVTGLSLKAHPISLVRDELKRRRVSANTDLLNMPDKSAVRVAGLVLVRQRPGTAKGTTFITLEDETGIANVVVWPRVWERHRRSARSAVALCVLGHVERAGNVVHVIADQMADLSDLLDGIAGRSRDFR
jgi:error-prone DNA polymerase